MSIMSYNGGAVMAMRGKNCVAIAADRSCVFNACNKMCILQEPDDLFETISQAMLNAVDRDAVTGMGVVVQVVEKDKITTRTLKARMD
ncbi:UNVERIFIED_CONTAM: hypothetical protein FKN15_056532 [Acipenser sinensis]